MGPPPKQPHPVSIQLAIQGGGAKLVLLLAALEALESFVRSSKIRVTRIAGTSAGAICGALFAAGVPMGEVKQRLLGLTNRQIRESFPPFAVGRFVRKFLFNKPYWDNAPIRGMLKAFLKSKGMTTLGDLQRQGIPFVPVRAHLGRSAADFVRDPDSHIVDSVLDSCAVPYYFESASGRTYVDGGICENLPADALLDGSDNNPIIAIAFEAHAPNRQPRNWIESTKFMVGTVIENSIQRARRQLGPERVLPLTAEFDMFDFPAAIKALGGAEYRAAKSEAEKFFSSVVARKEGELVIDGDPWVDPSLTISERLVAVHNLQSDASGMTITKSVVTIQSCGLSSPSDIGDYLSQELLFRPKGPLRSMSVGVGEVEGGRFVGKTIGKLVDRNNQTVKTEMFPVFTQDRERRLLFFFTPLQAGEDGERYRLTVQQRLDGIMPFRNKRDDITYIGEPAKGTVERVELVLLLPKDHVDVQLSPLSAQYPGRAMTEPELNAHNDHPSYRPHGWVGENIPPGERFGMLILASQ